MSMIGNFMSVPDATIESLLANPASITELLYPDGRARPADDEAQIDVDKAWHGIHYLLCGDPWKGRGPLAFINAGGERVGDVDVGYGPARAMRSSEVTQVHNALANVSSTDLRHRFDATKFEDETVYPEIWDEGEEALDYLLDNFDVLKRFVAATAGRGHGMLIWVS